MPPPKGSDVMPIPFLSQESPDLGDCWLVINRHTRGVDQTGCQRDHMDLTFAMMALLLHDLYDVYSDRYLLCSY